MKPITIIESPYACRGPDGAVDQVGIEINVEYARACMRDSLLRGEAPYASHLLYTQPGVLKDEVPGDRELGITSGFEFKRVADIVAVYTDLGISAGMQRAIDKERDDEFAQPHRVTSKLQMRRLPTGAMATLITRWAGVYEREVKFF